MINNKIWIFTRHKNQKHVALGYVNNCIKMIKYVFLPYYTHKRVLSFRNMLKMCHFTMTDHYYGYTKSHNPLYHLPGIFRDETNKVILNIPKLKTVWYKKELALLKTRKIIKPKINNVPNEALPKLINKGKFLYLHLPNKKYVSLYLSLMERSMKKLQHKFSIPELAYYLQLGVICHPFEKVNFSLLMNQVNTILLLNGFNPIPHGYLDFKCFICDTSSFTNLLTKAILHEKR